MGSNLIVVVFAVVVIGGMGSILGSIFTGLGLGVIEGLTKVFYPEASNTVVFVIMALCCWCGRRVCSGASDESRSANRIAADLDLVVGLPAVLRRSWSIRCW